LSIQVVRSHGGLVQTYRQPHRLRHAYCCVHWPAAFCTCSVFVSCRAATGPCDVAEMCSGNSTLCPTDAFAAAGTECRWEQGHGVIVCQDDVLQLCSSCVAAPAFKTALLKRFSHFQKVSRLQLALNFSAGQPFHEEDPIRKAANHFDSW